MVCQSQSGGSSAHLAIEVVLPFQDPEAGVGPPQGPSRSVQKKGSHLQHPLRRLPLRTKRSLDLHLQEHSRALKKGNVTGSAVAEHAFEAGHQVDLSKASVIDYHRHTQTRCLLESWLIQHHQAPLNREKGIMPRLYATLLD